MQSDVTVRDVMTRDYVGVSESDSLLNTVELMLVEGVETVIVLRGRRHVGLMTERDVLALVVGEGESANTDDSDPTVSDATVSDVSVSDVTVSDATVSDAMEPGVPTVGPSYGVGEAPDVMSTEGSGCLLVVDGDEPLGLVTERDLLSAATLDHSSAVGDGALREVEVLATGTESESGDRTASLEAQSICQDCGALARDLRETDGQLVCPDCRDV